MQGQNMVQKRRIENLARTGTEYPIMKQTTKFIPQHPAEEPLNTKPMCSQALIDEYIRNDGDRARNTVGSIVYDYVDPSPFYDNSPGDLYIDENNLIELPQANSQPDGAINEPYQKRYTFNTLNLPYSFE